MDRLMLTSARRRIELEQKHFPQGTPADAIKLLDDVQELLSRAYQAGYQAAERTVPLEWSNNACLGYALLAAEMMGLDETHRRKLAHSMNNRFDFKTLEEAKEAYCNSDY
ncbi:hypothetical protein [Paenibacillus sp. CMAA1364]